MADWFLTMLLGRDIVNPKVEEHAVISHAHYEPGQVIVPQHETRPFHYLIHSGEVEVVAATANGPSVVSTLTAGNYFSHLTHSSEGRCLRARTRVRLLAMDSDAAMALSDVRPDLAQLLKRNEPLPATAAGVSEK